MIQDLKNILEYFEKKIDDIIDEIAELQDKKEEFENDKKIIEEVISVFEQKKRNIKRI